MAALGATFISGVNFPERNNVWHVPIVLDYAATPEGPHDTYNASFSHFVSAFWIIPRLIATEANVQTIFVALQLVGNAALSLSIYLLIQCTTRKRALEPNPVRSDDVLAAGLVAAFFCFCHGLWNNTRLGNSEMFVAFATHSEFAVLFCLLSFTLLLQGRPIWSAILLSLAADANLFMAAWGGLSSAFFLIVSERRVLSRKQVSFAGLFVLLTAPVFIWALRSGGASGEIPLEFFRTFLGDHVYALASPQAAVQTFALGLAASFAVLVADRQDQRLYHLGLLMLGCVLVLGLGAVMPYVTNIRLLLLLHPLRYASIVVLLSACCAGALLVKATARGSRLDPIPSFIAVAGFMLKSPAVSIFGLMLVPRETTGWLRYLGPVLAMTGALGQLLYSPPTEVSVRSAWGFLLLCLVVSIAAWGRFAKSAPFDRMTTLVSAGGLGGVVAVPPFQQMPIAIVLSAVAVLACFWPVTTGRRLVALGANAGAGVLILLSVQSDPERLIPLLAGMAMLTIAAYVPRWRGYEASAVLRTAALCGIVAALVGGGFAKGAASGFSVAPSNEQHDFAAAGAWARAHTSPDTMFLLAGKDYGFTIFSRRPLWWASSQGAAVLWLPGFYDLYACRQRAFASATTPDGLATLAVLANIHYLMIRTIEVQSLPDPAFRVVFKNSHYVILQNMSGAVFAPLCLEK